MASVGAAAVLFVIASGQEGFSAVDSGFATNGYGDRSPGDYTLLAVLVAEVVLTAFFLFVIVGATDTLAPRGFAPLAIGLSLTLIHLVSIPVSNTSVNPARSTGPALFAGADAMASVGVLAGSVGRRRDRRAELCGAARSGGAAHHAGRDHRGVTTGVLRLCVPQSRGRAEGEMTADFLRTLCGLATLKPPLTCANRSDQ